MLLRCGRAAKPPVVGNVHKKLRAIDGEAPNFVRKNRLVTNKYRKGVSARQRGDGVGLSFVEAADFVGNAVDQAMGQRKRLILSKGHEMNLVIRKDSPALRVKEKRTVVRRRNRVCGGTRGALNRLPLDGPNEERMVKAARKTGSHGGELRILKRERRRRFGPH